MEAFALPLRDEVVALDGPDARRFCNNLFSNNARDLPVGEAQRSAMLDDRGRVRGVLDLICAAEDRFLVVLEGMSAADFEERYQLYVVLDDVEITSLPNYAVTTVQGLQPPEEPPEGVWVHRRLRLGGPGFDLVGERSRVREVVAGLGLDIGSKTLMETFRVLACKPRWPVDFGERNLTHEMRMRDEFLSFDKGCYLGQETVNRVDVMGQVKRILSVLRIDGVRPPSGASVLADGRKIGELTSPVDDGSGPIGLAVLKKPHDQPGTLLTISWEGGETRAEVVAPSDS